MRRWCYSNKQHNNNEQRNSIIIIVFVSAAVRARTQTIATYVRKHMNIKRSWPTYPLERFAAGPIVCSSLAVLVIIIVVLGGRWIIPLAHRTPESVGKASAEPTTLGVCRGTSRAQPAERRSARGALLENSFELGHQGGLLGVYQLT